MYGARDMHKLAVARAVEIGPRLINSNGMKLAIYGLTKKELRKLFVVENGYSDNRSAWLKVIESWGDEDLWGELVAKEFFMDGNWGVYVAFIATLSSDDILSLKLFAEKHSARAVYLETKEILPVYDLSRFTTTEPTTLDVVN